MTYTADQFIKSNKANIAAVQGLAVHAVTGVEKLVELNLATSKAVLSESFSHAQAVLAAKDAQELVALHTGLVQPMAEKSAAYGKHVYAIATDAGAEFTKAFETSVADVQKSFDGMVEKFAKNAPAGTESAMAAFKSAMNASQTAIESAKVSAKKGVEMAETSFAAIAKQAATVANNAAKAV